MKGRGSVTAEARKVLVTVPVSNDGVINQSPATDYALHDTAALEAVRQLQQMLGATVRTSRALVRCGRPIDLAGMDRHVGMLCAKTLDLQPETGRVMRAELVALLSDVEALCAALVGTDK